MKLSRIIQPLSVDDFLTRIFEREAALFRHTAVGLCGANAMWEAVVAAAKVAPQLLRVVRGGTLLAFPPALGMPLADWAKQSYCDGATLVLNKLEALDKDVRVLTERLSAELGARVSATVFLTPAQAQGFAPHFDTNDVFVVQVFGAKNWHVGGVEIPLPTKRQGYLVSASVAQDRAAQTYLLEVGDVLYVPRGRIHWATTDRQNSVHISLDLDPILASELVGAAIRGHELATLDIPMAIAGAPDRDLVAKVFAGLHFDADLVARIARQKGLEM